MKRVAAKTLNVMAMPAGGWAVRMEGRGLTASYSTQADAVEAAQALLRAGGGELRVQGVNGRTKRSFTLGRAAMAKINAVEGVALSANTQHAFEAFDLQGLSPHQRRTELRGALVSKVKP
jgi:hypothetical protein